ncbi:hypothetical protein DFP72DRAFT_904317 [Ephemerocybe angulata]|uniref:Uncharacterized protein n=1 Tax=Ephemerocybe angulata TaxID=980116 RepID=A0A8H6M303_9AGAR|nr:hypothetical protein DFP72DRAFT_904317 [Tulosesus angulatus]
MVSPSAIRLLAIPAGTWAIWWLLRRLARKDPLALVPGPPADFFTGNLTSFLDPETGLDLYDYLAKTCSFR